MGDYGGYEPLVVEIVKFFKTGKPPVSAEETIEIFAFMEAADESKRQGGKPVTIARSSARPARSPASDIRSEPMLVPRNVLSCQLIFMTRRADAATRRRSRSPIPARPPAPTRVRYGVLAFLAAMTFVLYLDRSCIGQAVPVIQKELRLTRVGQVGSSSTRSRCRTRSSRSRPGGGATATARGAS